MDQMLYSEDLLRITENLSNNRLKESLEQLRISLQTEQLQIYSWDENSIAISLVLNVDLPPLGNFQNVDIREKEPIL